MDICFFTMSDFNPKPMSKFALARNLVFSGVRADRPIWYFRIPKGEDRNRYKIQLLKSDLLPEAEKYVYMDADCLMLSHGKWEDESVFGARVEKPRDHRLHFINDAAMMHFLSILNSQTKPECNTGCVVVSGSQRKAVGFRWEYWCNYVDAILASPSGTRDQFHFRFVRKDLNIPDLPKEYCALATVEPIAKNSVLAHFSAISRSYPKYKDWYNKLLGKELHEEAYNENMKSRWKSIVHLVLSYAGSPERPVGAEIGVHKGETTCMLMKALPGLKLYAIDPWEYIPEQKKPWDKFYEGWLKVKEPFKDRIIEQRTFSLQAKVDEPLDFVFIDGNHTSLAVENDIRFWYRKVKKGGVIIGHDIGFRGTYYDVDSVKRGVEAVFGKSYGVLPGFVWWKQKAAN